jgi:hypothetical protein
LEWWDEEEDKEEDDGVEEEVMEEIGCRDCCGRDERGMKGAGESSRPKWVSLSLCIEFKRLLLNFFLDGPGGSQCTHPLGIRGAGRAWMELKTSAWSLLLLRCTALAGQEECDKDDTEGRCKDSMGWDDRDEKELYGSVRLFIIRLVAALDNEEEEEEEDDEEEEEDEEEEVEEEKETEGRRFSAEERDRGSSASSWSIWALLMCIAMTSTGATLLRSKWCRWLFEGITCLRSAARQSK